MKNQNQIKNEFTEKMFYWKKVKDNEVWKCLIIKIKKKTINLNVVYDKTCKLGKTD